MKLMRLLILGKSCSGKSTLCAELEKLGLKQAIWHTSRPKRDYEIHGKDYYFVSKNEIAYESMVVKNEYNGWLYGLSKESLDESNVVICTPENVDAIYDECMGDAIRVYIDLPMSLRLIRAGERNTADNIYRRAAKDETQFENFNSYDIKIELKENDALDNLIKMLKNLSK